MITRMLNPLIATAVLLAAWQALVTLAGLPPFILPGPWRVGEALVGNAGLIAFNAGATLIEVVIGLVLGAILGTLTALGLVASPLARRIVSASSSACVGCSCWPSPALTTEQSTLRASRCTAPAWLWRTTMMSGRIAFSVAAVSISVSPFFTLELATAMFITSAPSRLPASSKEDCVRVEASKNRLICVRPRSVARFFST